MDDQRVKDIAHSDGEVAMSTTSSNDGDTALATEPKVMTTQPDEAISSSSSQNTDKGTEAQYIHIIFVSISD